MNNRRLFQQFKNLCIQPVRILGLGLCLSLPLMAYAAADRPQIGTVTMAIGEAEVIRATGATEAATQGMPLYSGDQLITRAGGHLHLRFIDNGLVSVRPGSLLRLDNYDYNPQQPDASRVRFTLQEGIARSVSGAAAQQDYSKFRLNTPVAAIGVRGTDFTVSAAEGRVRTFVSEGAIVVSPFSEHCSSQSLGPCMTTGVELSGLDQQFVELQESDIQTQLFRFSLPEQPTSGLLVNERLIAYVKQQAIVQQPLLAKASLASTQTEAAPVVAATTAADTTAEISTATTAAEPTPAPVATSNTGTITEATTEMTAEISTATTAAEPTPAQVATSNTGIITEATTEMTAETSTTTTAAEPAAPAQVATSDTGTITETTTEMTAETSTAAEPAAPAQVAESEAPPTSEPDTGETEVADVAVQDLSQSETTVADSTTDEANTELTDSEQLADHYAEIQSNETITTPLEDETGDGVTPPITPNLTLFWRYHLPSSNTENQGTTPETEGDLIANHEEEPLNLIASTESKQSLNSQTQDEQTTLASTADNTASNDTTASETTAEGITNGATVVSEIEVQVPPELLLSDTTLPEGFETVVARSGFSLYRPISEQLELEAQLGVVNFNLDQAFAFYGRGDQQVNLEVLESQLQIDFAAGAFSTGLVLHHDTTGLVDFKATGNITTDGKFSSYAEGQLLEGATTLDGKRAGYYFEKQIEQISEPLQGITTWNSVE